MPRLGAARHLPMSNAARKRNEAAETTRRGATLPCEQTREGHVGGAPTPNREGQTTNRPPRFDPTWHWESWLWGSLVPTACPGVFGGLCFVN